MGATYRHAIFALSIEDRRDPYSIAEGSGIRGVCDLIWGTLVLVKERRQIDDGVAAYDLRNRGHKLHATG